MELMKYNNPVKVLVTGGAGFIGSNICEYLLKQGNEVICLDNLLNGSLMNIKGFDSNPKFTFINDSITDFDICMEASRGVDFIFHEAALGSVPRSMKYPLLYEENNIRGTSNIFEAARQNGVKRVIYASSSSVYGNDTSQRKKENREGDVLSVYALSKGVVEAYAKLYNNMFGLETIGLRYFNVFGARQKLDGPYAAVIPRFITNLLNGTSTEIYGDGKQSRDFTYILNVIKANYLASIGDEKCVGKVYNVGCGESHSINELYKYLANKINNSIKACYVDERKGDVKNSLADLSSVKNDLGYYPGHKFFEGLDLTIDWYRKHLKIGGSE